MAGGRVDNETFLARLTDMYSETRETGTVTVTFKKVQPSDLSKGPRALRVDALPGGQACLVRAAVSGGKREGSALANRAKGKTRRKGKAKLSTLLLGTEQAHFQTQLAEVFKAQWDGMRKLRDMRKKKQPPPTRKATPPVPPAGTAAAAAQ